MTNRGRTTQLWKLLVALLAVLAMFAAGCGSDNDGDTAESVDDVEAVEDAEEPEPEESEPEPEPEEEPEPEPEESEPEPEPEPAADPDEGTGDGSVESAMLPVSASGEAVVGMATSVPGLEYAAFPNFGFMTYYTPYLEGLVTYLPDGTVGPQLASDWEFSDDRTSVTFNLRTGVTFSDGSDFTADAVIANFESMKERGAPPNAGALAPITSMEAPDDNTVVLTLANPDPFLILNQLAGLAGLIVSPDSLGGDPAEYSGTGPWTLVEFRPGDSISYEARDEYYSPEDVKIQSLVFVAGELPALAQGLAAGDLNAIGFIPLGFVRDIENAVPVRREGGTSVGMTITDPLGETIPALADRDNRCAVFSAINRQQVGGAIGNAGSNEIINGDFPGSLGGYEGDASYDAEGAADRLAAAGIADLGSTGAFGLLNNVAAGVTASFEAAGVTYAIEAIEAPQATAALADGRYPVQVINFGDPQIQMLRDRALGDGPLNASGYEAPGVRDAYDAALAAAATNDEAAYNEAVAAGFKAMYDDCLWAGLFVGSNASVVDGTQIANADTRLGMPLGIWLRGAEVIG